MLELTRKCNLRCRHCYATPHDGRKELTYNEILETIDKLRNLGTLFLTVTGGDPTVNKNFFDILKYATDKRMAVQILTNAVLIDTELAEKISKLNVFHVSVSMYGATAETHDNVTGRRGSWEKAIRAVNLLQDKKIFTVVKFIIMKINVHEYDLMIKLAKKMGFKYKVNVAIRPRDNLSLDTSALRISEKELAHVFHDQFENLFHEKPTREDRSDLLCSCARTIMCINAYGDVYPCVSWPISAGNIRDIDLGSIWTGSPLFKAIRNKFHLKNLHTCPECALRPYCNRTAGNAYVETGDLFGPSPSACIEALTWKKTYNQIHEINEEIKPPRGLDLIDPCGHNEIPGFRHSQVTSISGTGCDT